MINNWKFQNQRDSEREDNYSKINFFCQDNHHKTYTQERKSIEQEQKSTQKDRLNKIIAKTFKDLNNDQIEVSIQESQYENERKKLFQNCQDPENGNKFQFSQPMFDSNQEQSYFIVNSSNKNSFERGKQPISNRVPGKLTKSDDSMETYQVRRSQDEDQNQYYNFTIKNSVLNSQHFFDFPQHESQIQTYEPLQASNKNYQTKYFSNQHQHSPRLDSTKNKSGFIKQNRLNSRNKIKSQQEEKRAISKLISEQQEFQIQPNARVNDTYHSNKLDEQDRNKILDDDFWRKVDEQKSATQSLKHTFDTSKTNGYPINSPSHNDFLQKTKDRTNYSDFQKDENFDDQFCSSEKNQFNKEYQADLFEFIKKEMINITVKSKQFSQKEQLILIQLTAQKDKNLNLYHLYKKTKSQFKDHINQQKDSLYALENEIKLLEEQIVFYKDHSNSMEKSISLKMKKQDDFYFKHKASLQEIILSNNQKISQLKNQLFRIQNQRDQVSSHQQISSKNNKSLTLHSSMIQNQRLKLELKEEQLSYDKILKKVRQNHQAIHQLQKRKADEIKALVQQFQAAKKLIPSEK